MSNRSGLMRRTKVELVDLLIRIHQLANMRDRHATHWPIVPPSHYHLLEQVDEQIDGAAKAPKES